jgi:hypothetical protein
LDGGNRGGDVVKVGVAKAPQENGVVVFVSIDEGEDFGLGG